MFAAKVRMVAAPVVLAVLVAVACAPTADGTNDFGADESAGGSSSGGSAGGGQGGMLPVGGTVGTGGTAITPPDPTGGSGGCKNLQCRQQVCPEGSATTVTGTVYAPNGTLPIYNALVYVPNAPLTAFPPGLACDRCGSLPAGEPVVSAVTDAQGVFRLTDVPVGADVPIVIQVGKWRRQLVVPNVTACTETTLTDHDLTRLPRNRSEGDMPRIGVTTGSLDNLICVIAKLGIDPNEWGIAGEGKAVTFYAGMTAAFDHNVPGRFTGSLTRMTPASDLWGNFETLSQYDLAIFSCEGEEALDEKGDAAWDAVTRYVSAGGRIFGTDYQYVWYQHSTDPNWVSAATVPGPADPAGNPTGDTSTPIFLDTSFPKGKALADWLAVVATDSPYGQVLSEEVFDNFSAARAGATQVWGNSGTLENPTLMHPRFLTVNQPVGVPVAEQCGKSAHLDAHITQLSPAEFLRFPDSCGTELQNGEQVLAFFLFDLAACIQEDSKPVEPPPTTDPH